MEKRLLLGVATIILILYAGGLIFNPHLKTDKKTVFIEGNMDDILGVSTQGVPLSTETRDNSLEAHFREPVSTMFLQLNRTVLDSEPHRFRFDMAILSRKELFVNVSVIKILDLSPPENQTVGKAYTFSSNESSFVYVRVWRLRGKRHEVSDDSYTNRTYTDKIKLQVITPYNPGEEMDHISGIIIHNFRYVYYAEGTGKRGAPIPLGLKEILVFYLPFILALYIPFLILLKRNWEEFFT
ncbi:MAG: hypothetical protein GWO20_01310 [Candidatus Korarchaeota archaeon]|nr:hypothetical protein [Candidatus Korarchaeota archaeon]NIU83083.1 hypothetical protein [Candidatus Thorarchaeota archaeon]NIW12627.1 hypothetical protein [Candidatus Thorarchaeota archaeon]NIW50838.1 hypothetical protein [Candidatus Korarchaeota archaeon]